MLLNTMPVLLPNKTKLDVIWEIFIGGYCLMTTMVRPFLLGSILDMMGRHICGYSVFVSFYGTNTLKFAD